MHQLCMQTWNNAQVRKQCLCKFYVFGVKFQNVPKFACVKEEQYSVVSLNRRSGGWGGLKWFCEWMLSNRWISLKLSEDD